MLFNSYPFLLIFLPLTLIGYEIAGRFQRRVVIAWLSFASLAFYAYWKPVFLLVLLCSIGANYLFASLISRRIPNLIPSSTWLWTAIASNLAALCYFKYLFPFLNIASRLSGSSHLWTNVVLPLGISFFTFTQIAYLVDLQQGVASYQDLLSYVLFVTFFPHLIAGPILHHKDIMPQFQQNRAYRLQLNDLAVGITWFAMGLFKKVVIADTLAPTANLVFTSHGAISTSDAWLGVLTYTMQLYFDFSGYCDMANGLARMFSIDFPLNFSSPFKATNIIDFWARWHITLTQYITAYLYSPMQKIISRRRQDKGKKVSRKAQATLEGFSGMVALPTLLTMLIAGVWHGAGFQFFIFGGLHGLYITLVHLWRTFFRKDSDLQVSPLRRKLNHAFAVSLTFTSVVFANIFFRAPSTSDAFRLLHRMIGLPVLHNAADQVVLETPLRSVIILLVAAVIVWCFPNTQQILARFKPALQLTPADGKKRLIPIYWTPSVAWSLVVAVIFMLSMIHSQDLSTFLYFQF